MKYVRLISEEMRLHHNNYEPPIYPDLRAYMDKVLLAPGLYYGLMYNGAIQAILKDQHQLLPAIAYLQGYSLNNFGTTISASKRVNVGDYNVIVRYSMPRINFAPDQYITIRHDLDSVYPISVSIQGPIEFEDRYVGVSTFSVRLCTIFAEYCMTNKDWHGPMKDKLVESIIAYLNVKSSSIKIDQLKL